MTGIGRVLRPLRELEVLFWKVGGGVGVAVSRVTGSKITLAVVRADCKGYEAALDSRREGMVAEPKEVAARGQGDNTLIQDVL